MVVVAKYLRQLRYYLLYAFREFSTENYFIKLISQSLPLNILRALHYLNWCNHAIVVTKYVPCTVSDSLTTDLLAATICSCPIYTLNVYKRRPLKLCRTPTFDKEVGSALSYCSWNTHKLTLCVQFMCNRLHHCLSVTH